MLCVVISKNMRASRAPSDRPALRAGPVFIIHFLSNNSVQLSCSTII